MMWGGGRAVGVWKGRSGPLEARSMARVDAWPA